MNYSWFLFFLVGLQAICLWVGYRFPVLMGLFQKQNNKASAAWAIGFGAGSFFICRLITIPFPHELIEIAASLIGYGMGSVFWKREK